MLKDSRLKGLVRHLGRRPSNLQMERSHIILLQHPLAASQPVGARQRSVGGDSSIAPLCACGLCDPDSRPHESKADLSPLSSVLPLGVALRAEQACQTCGSRQSTT